jgi:hypothetical protein
VSPEATKACKEAKASKHLIQDKENVKENHAGEEATEEEPTRTAKTRKDSVKEKKGRRVSKG